VDVTAALLSALVGSLLESDPSYSPWFDAQLSGLPDLVKSNLWQAVKSHPPGATLLDAFSAANAAAQGAGYQVYSLADALKPAPPVQWVINRLFSAGSLSLLVGDPGSKKTYALLDAAVCVAMGKDWLGRSTRQCPALIIDAESGPRRLGRRLGETARGHGADDCTPVYYASLAMLDLTQDIGALELEALIVDRGAGFVVIDALADIMPGADENAVKDTQPVFRRLRDIAERTGAALVLIHHANKNGGYRGSSAINGAVDLLLFNKSEEDSPTITFETVKARDTEPQTFSALAHFDPIVDPFDPGAQMFYLTEAGQPAAPTPQEKALRKKGPAYVLRYLEACGGTALRDDIISHADSCSESSAKTAIGELVEAGLLFRVDSGKRGSPATYSTQKPEPEEQETEVV